MCAVRVGESFVYKYVAQAGELFCKTRIVCLLARVESQVLTQFKRHMGELVEARGNRSYAQRLHYPATGTPQVCKQDYLCGAPRVQKLECGQYRADAGVVYNLPTL